ncbi:MAG: hypothetical protein M3Q58_03605 [Bacteroidota bacterium]|nr:hypothetical protein [Bacteroidota bacterium]
MSNKLTPEEEEKAFTSQEFHSHQYDVDLLLAYKQMRKIANDNSIGEKEAKMKFLNFLEGKIRHYSKTICNSNFNLHLKHDKAIVFDINNQLYDKYLAILLIGYDVNRIKGLLDYQLACNNNHLDFIAMVEFLVYRFVEQDSPFENSKRLKEIMKWVETKRIFVPVTEVNLTTESNNASNPKNDLQKPNGDTEDNGKEEQPDKPLYNQKIFTSYKGWQIFEEYKNEIVTFKNEYSAYSYLFGELKKDEFIHEMKHMKFIDYLSEEHGSKIKEKGYNQFSSASSKENIKAYSRYKNRFQ